MQKHNLSTHLIKILLLFILFLTVTVLASGGGHNGVLHLDGSSLSIFWIIPFAGILSSFLDNVPTYLVFFNAAGGGAATLMGSISQTLLAISAGAVFMGANTYIGNAPNFMVKSITEASGMEMLSFFGYLVKWSLPILFPLFSLVIIIFF